LPKPEKEGEEMEPKSIDFAAMPRTAINVVTKPAEFFQGMPKTGGFLEPLVFAVILGVMVGIIQTILGFIGLGHVGAYGPGLMGGFGMVVFTPIAVAIGSFIGGAIFFVIWKLMGSPEEYETAYRCGAYLMALAPITAITGTIPYAGGIINMVIYVFFLVTVSIHVHHIPSQKAWLVFGILGAVFALLGVFAEYKARNMESEMGKWRRMGYEYRQSGRDMEKSTEEMRKRAEEMAKQIKEETEEAKKQTRQNQ